MKQLRLGIIGCAGRGQLADHAHNPSDGVEVVAGADIYEDGRARFLKRYKEKFDAVPATYGDYREMLEKEHLDGVFITSPDFLHEEHAVYALEHHVPVYLEKPLAISIAGADRILETAYRSRTPLMLGHNMRYMDYIRKLKELVDTGAIGEVKAVWCRHFVSYGGDAYFRDWHAKQSLCNSLLLQKGAHDIDVIHWLAGSYTVRTSGIGSLSVYDKLPRRPASDKRIHAGIQSVWTADHWPPDQMRDMYPEIEVNDLNMVNLELASGVKACYLQCHYTPDAWRNYTVIGTRGRIENYGNESVQLWSRRVDKCRLEGDATFRMPPPAKNGHGGADPRIVKSFVDALRGVYDVWSTPQAARYSVAAGCQAADSIRQGGIPLDVPPLPEHLEKYDFIRAKVLD